MARVYSADRARYEQNLAAAHRAVFFARNKAVDLGDEGAEHDLDAILRELTRLAQASLAPRSPRRRAAHPRVAAPTDERVG